MKTDLPAPVEALLFASSFVATWTAIALFRRSVRTLRTVKGAFLA